MRINYQTLVITLIAIVTLTACSNLPVDLGRSDVDQLAGERGVLTNNDDTAELIVNLLGSPLTMESAVRIALINNPSLRQSYSNLGFAAADVYDAGRIRNPVLSVAALDSDQAGDSNRYVFSLVTSFTDLLTLSARTKFAENEFLAVKQDIAASVLQVVIDTQTAYFKLIAAKQNSSLRKQKSRAADLSLQLAQRYQAAGNMTAYAFSIEQANTSTRKLEQLQSEAEVYLTLAQLARLLGISVGDAWTVQAQLPLPLELAEKKSDLLTMARERRLDLAAARIRADNLAEKLAVVDWTRWLGELNVGIERERETDGANLTGLLLNWELPIFTQNRGSFLRADAQLQQAVIEVARLILATDNEVRLALAAMNNAAARAYEYQRQLVPARISASARAQEQEAFMLIGVFDLLEAKQQEYDSYQGYLKAVSDYWLARVDLSRAVGSALPGPPPNQPVVDINSLIKPVNNGAQQMHDLHRDADMNH